MSEELAAAGGGVHLGDPAETAAFRGRRSPGRRAARRWTAARRRRGPTAQPPRAGAPGGAVGERAVQAAPPAWFSAKLHAAHRQWCATAPCTTADRTARLRLHRRARRASPPSAGGSRTWYVTSPGITIPAADAPAPQCNPGRRVRLSAARVRRSGPAAAPRWPPTASSSVRCAKYVRRPGDRQCQYTHHRGQDRGAPRRRPEAPFGLLLGSGPPWTA